MWRRGRGVVVVSVAGHSLAASAGLCDGKLDRNLPLALEALAELRLHPRLPLCHP